MKPMRWSDSDRYFGPFTYAKEGRSYRRLAVVLSSGDGDDYPGCSLRLCGFGHTLIAALPAVIKPWREKGVATSWDAATIARLGRNWYYNTAERSYGFSYAEGFLQVFRGLRTDDSSTDKTWSWFLPWTQWRHVRHSIYDLDGAHYADMPNRRRGAKFAEPGFLNHLEAGRALEAACPSRTFPFRDFDGEALTATTRIEEREWRFGVGWFKWLSLFRRPKVRRSLDIHFSGETGKRKGSWKGGTIGHSIEMLPGELHEAAFRRYCAANNMTFGDGP